MWQLLHPRREACDASNGFQSTSSNPPGPTGSSNCFQGGDEASEGCGAATCYWATVNDTLSCWTSNTGTNGARSGRPYNGETVPAPDCSLPENDGESAYSCKFDGESPSGEQQTVTCVQPPANLCVTSWCVGSAGSLTCGPGNGNDPVCISGATGQDISNFAFFYTCCPGSATTTTTTTTTTTAVPSCVNEEFDCPSEVGFLPLQVINTGNRNNQNLVASIRSLDITTGQYSDVCEVQGVDLNACGLAQSNFIYCVARDSNEGEINPGQLVRVTCPLPTQEGPGVGSVCYLGLVQGRPFSGTTDTRVDSMLTLNGNTLFNYSNIDSLVANGLGWSFQNQSTENLPRTSASTNVPSSSSIADPCLLGRRCFVR